MLRHAEGQRVDAHEARALPEAAAGVVAGAAELEHACGQVGEGVAAHQQRIVGHAAAHRVVEILDGHGSGFGAVGERPAVVGKGCAILHAPAAEEVEAGEILLDELIAPGFQAAEHVGDLAQHLGDGGVEHAAAVQLLRRDGAAQLPGIGDGLAREQRAQPDAGADVQGADAVGEGAHVGIVGVGGVPRAAVVAAAVLDLPAVVDDHEGAVGQALAPAGDAGGVGEDVLGGADAVGIVPVVAAVDGRFGQAGCGAQQAHQAAGGGEGGLACVGGELADGAQFKRAAHLHAHAAAAGVQGEGDALRVDLPPAQRVGAGAHARAAGLSAVVVQEEPRQHALGHEIAPFQVAVAALPVVAQHAARGDGAAPAQEDAADRLRGDEQRKAQGVLFLCDAQRGSLCLPQAGFGVQRDGFALQLRADAVGLTDDVQFHCIVLHEEFVWGARRTPHPPPAGGTFPSRGRLRLCRDSLFPIDFGDLSRCLCGESAVQR